MASAIHSVRLWNTWLDSITNSRSRQNQYHPVPSRLNCHIWLNYTFSKSRFASYLRKLKQRPCCCREKLMDDGMRDFNND
jgi:hypothetical protein